MRWSGLKPENAEFPFPEGERAFSVSRDVFFKGGVVLAALALGVGVYFLLPRGLFDKFRDKPLVEQENFWIRNPAGYARNLVGVDQIAVEKFEVIAPVNATDKWSMRGVIRNNAGFAIDEVTIAVFVSECGDPADGCLLGGQDRRARIALGHVEPGGRKDFYQFVDMRAFGARNETYLPATDKWIMNFLVTGVRASSGALSGIARATQARN